MCHAARRRFSYFASIQSCCWIQKRGGNVFLLFLCLMGNALSVVEEAVHQTALVGSCKQVSYLFSLFCLDMALVTELYL